MALLGFAESHDAFVRDDRAVDLKSVVGRCPQVFPERGSRRTQNIMLTIS